MAAMHKLIKVQLMSNGLILIVDKANGEEEQFLMQDDSSAAYRTIRDAAQKAAGTASAGEPYREPPEEPRRATVVDEDGSGVVDDDDEEDYEGDDESFVGGLRVLGKGAADFLNSNPGVAQFAGSLLGGLNNAEKRRQAMKDEQARRGKKRK